MKIDRTTLAVAAAPLIGFIYALTIFSVSFLTGSNEYWTLPYGDISTYMIGSIYFVHDAWRFPIFYVPSLSFPEGASIFFTDSIPLLALLAKVFFKISGYWVNYFGFYIVACFPFLALFSALTVRQAGSRDPIVILGAVLLALASPALLIRFGHAALMGHFLIVWALYLYFKLLDDPTNPWTLTQFGCVVLVAEFVQAYFMLMVFAVLLAAMAQLMMERRASLRFAATGVGLVATAAILLAWLGGAIGSGTAGSSGTWGYGHYSMNLLSPIVPPREHVPEFLARHITWDGGDRTWDATGGQYEGYNYLGAGLILLLVVQLTAWRTVTATLRQHVFLALLAAAFVAYALSNRIFIGDWLALDVKLPGIVSKFVSQFRTGGRYFWPVYYMLVVALTVATWRRFSPRVAHTLIVAAVLLQLADTQVLRRNAALAAAQGQPPVLAPEDWRPLLAEHQFLMQYPSFQCGGWAGEWPGNNSNMELLRMAADQNLPTNSAYLARPNRSCEQEILEGERFDVQDGGLYTFARRFPLQVIEHSNSFRAWCRQFAFGVVCTRHWDKLAGRSGSSFAPISESWVPNYSLGTTLKFSAGGNGMPYLAGSWSIPEPWGIWSLGQRSDVALRLPPTSKADYRVAIDAFAFVYDARPTTSVTVLANGEPVATLNYAGGEGNKKFSFAVPTALLEKTGGILRLSFVSADPKSPKDAGVSTDTRKLSLALIGMVIVE